MKLWEIFNPGDSEEEIGLPTHYMHTVCQKMTPMDEVTARAYQENPELYSGAYCEDCLNTFPVEEFEWVVLSPDEQS